MSLSKKTFLKLAATAAISAYAFAAAISFSNAQTAPAAAPTAAQQAEDAAKKAAIELDTIDSFSDRIYQNRVDYFKTVSHKINFNTANFPDQLKKEYNETFRDFGEAVPRRSNWILPTEGGGWVSAGGVDLYEVHIALMRAERKNAEGKTIYGPIMVTDAMMTDLRDKTKRVEAAFGNKILSFKSVENRDAYAKLVEGGHILELQDMQCAMAPVHPKRPHLVGATRMAVVAEVATGNDGKPVLVRTYNSAHVLASYDLKKCAGISNAAFGKLSDDARTHAGAAVLVKQLKLDDQRIPAFTPINPIHDVSCAPLS